MSKAESAESVVVAFPPESRGGYEPSLLMAGLAELSRVVTITAVRFTRVSRGWMTREEILRMIA